MGTFEFVEFPQDAFPEDALPDDSVIGEEEGGSPGGQSPIDHARRRAMREDAEMLLILAHFVRML